MPFGSTRHIATVVAMLTLGVGAAPAEAGHDPLLDRQWGLQQSATGAPEAWTQSHGAGVLVAILDSGVQLDHPELADSLWRNPGEIAGNGIDDDHDGYVDDVNGANVMQRNGNVGDDNGHGTHVAGIVAAQAGNGIGGSGIAPEAKVMAVKVLDAGRAGDSSQLAKGIVYAVDRGARILNVSINGDGTSGDLEAALRYAGSKGATVVASAGNNGRDIDVTPSYPASSPEPAVLVATATQPIGTLIPIANRGVRDIDVAAPGASILSTALGSGFELRQGTSMAAPFVAGALALLASARPDLPQAALRDALTQSARRAPLLSGLLGGGALNVASAMHRVRPGSLWRSGDVRSVALPLGRAAKLKVTTKSRIRRGRRSVVRWKATNAAPVARWRVYLDGRRVAIVRGRRTRLSKRVRRAGTHRWKVVGADAHGRRVVVAARTFRVVRAR